MKYLANALQIAGGCAAVVAAFLVAAPVGFAVLAVALVAAGVTVERR
jgi:hypothetical protein